MSAKERLNLVVSPRTRTRIEGLQDRLDSGSLSDVIRQAIQLLDLITERQIEGDKIVVRAKDGSETELTVVL
ncbi:MAG: hypothetical protein AAF441_25635 [Pseudomonadota bacterium]